MRRKTNGREQIEWVNYWWEDANDNSKERWLLLGDSVIRQIRSTLNRMVGDKIAIDCFCTSTYLDDELLMKEIKDFISVQDYHYSKILINVGFHHGLDRNVAENSEDERIFRKAYEDIVELCLIQCDNIVMISGTLEAKTEDFDSLDDKINKEIEARNRVVSEICKINDFIYIDLFHYFKKKHFKYKHRDNVHFFRNADTIMSRLVYKAIKQDLDEDKEIADIKVLGLIELENIIKEDSVYLYGAGEIGNILMKYIEAREGEIKGFVISDGQRKRCAVLGKEVFYISEKQAELENGVLLLAMDNPFLVENVLAQYELSAYCISEDDLDFIRKYVELVIS